MFQRLPPPPSLPPMPTPGLPCPQLSQAVRVPVGIVWGEADPWERVEQGRQLAQYPSGASHCDSIGAQYTIVLQYRCRLRLHDGAEGWGFTVPLPPALAAVGMRGVSGGAACVHCSLCWNIVPPVPMFSQWRAL